VMEVAAATDSETNDFVDASGIGGLSKFYVIHWI